MATAGGLPKVQLRALCVVATGPGADAHAMVKAGKVTVLAAVGSQARVLTAVPVVLPGGEVGPDGKGAVVSFDRIKAGDSLALTAGPLGAATVGVDDIAGEQPEVHVSARVRWACIGEKGATEATALLGGSDMCMHRWLPYVCVRAHIRVSSECVIAGLSLGVFCGGGSWCAIHAEADAEPGGGREHDPARLRYRYRCCSCGNRYCSCGSQTTCSSRSCCDCGCASSRSRIRRCGAFNSGGGRSCSVAFGSSGRADALWPRSRRYPRRHWRCGRDARRPAGFPWCIRPPSGGVCGFDHSGATRGDRPADGTEGGRGAACRARRCIYYCGQCWGTGVAESPCAWLGR